jgi:formylglycine-generating enzyme required for sulfatase activity
MSFATFKEKVIHKEQLLPTIITINGIEESISNLQYRNKSALKYQLVHAIHDFYQDEKSTETLQAIDSDKLIQRLWQIGNDPIALKNKRKNLNSIKSTVNTDLRKLYQEGLNPEGIVIGPANVFIMSEEAKEAAFETFRSTMEKTGSIDLGKMLEVLSIINESLSNVEGIIEKEGSSATEKMNELKSLIQGLAGKVNLERSPEKLQIQTDQEERPRSKEPQPESASPEPWRPAEGRAPLRELSDYPEHEEETEMTGEVFEEDLDQDEMAQLKPDGELETAELSGDELERMDEMALADQPVDSQAFIEQEIIEDDLELIEEPADREEPLLKDDGEVEIAAEQIPVEDQEFETDEFATDAELETEELSIEDAEIADDTDFIAEEMGEESVTLTDQEDPIAEIEEETFIETSATSVTEALAEPGPTTVIEDFIPEDMEMDEGLNVEIQEAQIEEAELETEIVEGALSAEAAGVFEDQEKEDITETAVEEAPEEPPAEILESEEIDAVTLFEDEELAEDMESEDEKSVKEDQADSEELEAVEAMPEPEGILEEAAEDIEELDLDEAFEEPVVTVIPEADQEEEVIGTETEPPSLMEGADLADDIIGKSEEQSLALDEEELSEALIEEEETAIEEEPEAVFEFEPDPLLEVAEDRKLVDEGEIVPELEEIVEDELEEAESLDTELESEELSADEILEEIEDEPLTETAIEAEEDDSIETDTTGYEPSASAGESNTPPPILPEGLFGFAEADINANSERARYLAEDFNDSLAAMDKFHNQYILIPQGHYVIGSRQAQRGTQAESVKELTAFYIGKFPVTNALFEIFIEKTGYKTTAEKLGFGLVYYPRCRQTKNERSGLNMVTYRSALVSEVVKDACWYQPSGPGSTLHHKRNHPVVQVGLEDALAFAAWTGKRLPREEEWEAAGRGVKGLIYPWGARWKKGACNMEESDLGDTAPVEFYAEFGHEFGLVDMLGNVLEWTLDTSEENGRRYYVVKGGSWISKPGVRLTERLKLEKETCSNILGFRCVAY